MAHVDMRDVGLGRCQRRRHARQHALAIDHRHQDLRLERTHRVIGPVHRDETFAVLVLQLAGNRAFAGMDHQAFTAPKVTDDVVARYRAAAGGVMDRGVFAAVQRHATLRHRLVGGKALARQQQRIRFFAGFLGQQTHQALGHDGRDTFAQADVGQQLGLAPVAGKTQQALPHVVVGGVVVRELLYAFCAQSLGQQLLAETFGLGMCQRLEMVPDLGARAPGAHKTQPGRIRARHRRGDHFDHVAVLEFAAQRHLFAVDARGHGTVTHVAVDRVGKVHHRGTARQRQYLALGREHIDCIGEQVHLDVVPELGRVAGFVLDVEQ